MTDREIIDLIIRRDEKGLSELLKHYGPMIRYIITPVLHNYHDQEECISEITLKIWDNISLFDERKANFRTWITAISRNAALNLSRKNRKYEYTDLISEALSAKNSNPEEILLNKEKQEHFQSVINMLAGKDRTLFYRKYYYMQSTAQIAREMGITERAVEGRLYRIKNRIRKQMGGWEDE